MLDKTVEAVQEQKAKIAAIEAQIKALSERIARANDEIASLKPKFEIERSRLDGMIEIVNLLSENKVLGIGPFLDDNEINKAVLTVIDEGLPKRRMRLGPKKRVVFQLIQNGVTSLTAITDYLKDTDIDSRFVRDCLRNAAAEGELTGDFSGYYLTKLGQSLLNNAPISKEWENYRSLFELHGFIDILG